MLRGKYYQSRNSREDAVLQRLSDMGYVSKVGRYEWEVSKEYLEAHKNILTSPV
jgi:hypothetical protein